MAIDARSFNGSMVIDAAPELLKQGDYSYAMNVQNGVEGIKNILGNRTLSSIPAPVSGTDWICGEYWDKTRQRVYYFVFNSDFYNRIVVVDVQTEVSTVIFDNLTDTGSIDILDWGNDTVFNPARIIKDIEVIHRDFGGDLVYFIDPNKIPLKFNYDTMSSGGYGSSITLEMLKVMKSTPKVQPLAIYADDTSRAVNNLKKKLFQFKYRHVYSDDEKSTWSAVSNLALPPQNDNQDYYADGTKANVINVNVQTGIKTVSKIEIAARNSVSSVWSDFYLIDTINKSDLSLLDDSNYEYKFYNDGAYNFIDVQESNLLHDYVPDEANTMAVANGNILVYGGIKEGLDKEVALDVSSSVSASASVVTNVIMTVNATNINTKVVTFTGTVTTGDIFRLDIYLIDEVTHEDQPVITITYTAISGDDLADVISQLNTRVNAEIDISSTFTTTTLSVVAGTGFNMDVIDTFFTAGATTTSNDSVTSFKWKGRYQFGICYYRNDGKTRGVYIPRNGAWTVDMPAYSEVASVPQVPSVTLDILNAIPSWADYFHIVRTTELTASKATFVITSGCGQSGDYTYLKIDNLDTHALDFPSTEAVVPYDYAKGDRIRILKRITSTATVLNSYDFDIIGIVTDPVSLPTGDYIKIKTSTLMSAYGFGTTTNKYLIELYSPAQVVEANLNVYYEMAQRFDVYSDSNGNRSHKGNIRNQIQGTGAQSAQIGLTDGDYYLRERKLTTGASGTLTTYTCMDMNFSDSWLSAVSNTGRPLVIDDNIKKQYYPALMRHSLQYIQGTSINLLSRFYPENFEDADISYGDILRMKTRENFIRVFQRYKVGSVPVFRQIFIDTQNSSNVALSERVLNKINYYAGDYGIDKYGSSLVSTDYGDYFLDTNNKAMCRASLDGITNVSDTYLCASWFNENVTEDHFGFGVFDYERRIVIMGIGIMDGTDYVADLIGFNEQKKGFESFYRYNSAYGLLFINGRVWSFRERPYVHDNQTRNNFFGAQETTYVTTVFNRDVMVKKTFIGVEELSSSIWTCNIKTGDVMVQNSDVSEADFQTVVGALVYDNKEGKFDSVIRRDQNSVGGKYFGDTMKGCYAIVELTNNKTTEQRLISVTLKYILSQLTNM